MLSSIQEKTIWDTDKEKNQYLNKITAKDVKKQILINKGKCILNKEGLKSDNEVQLVSILSELGHQEDAIQLSILVESSVPLQIEELGDITDAKAVNLVNLSKFYIASGKKIPKELGEKIISGGYIGEIFAAFFSTDGTFEPFLIVEFIEEHHLGDIISSLAETDSYCLAALLDSIRAYKPQFKN